MAVIPTAQTTPIERWARNTINNDLFIGSGRLDAVEIQRRLSLFVHSVNEVVDVMLDEIKSLSDTLNGVTNNSDYNGTIYAVDERDNTVELRVVGGKIERAEIVDN